MKKLQTAIAVNVALALGALSAPSFKREEGQTFVEYALLIAGIAILLIVAIIFLKDRIANLFSDTGSSLSNPVGS